MSCNELVYCSLYYKKKIPSLPLLGWAGLDITLRMARWTSRGFFVRMGASSREGRESPVAAAFRRIEKQFCYAIILVATLRRWHVIYVRFLFSVRSSLLTTGWDLLCVCEPRRYADQLFSLYISPETSWDSQATP